MATKVTDPAILAQLNGGAAPKGKVTDPALLAALNGPGAKPGSREYADWAAQQAKAGKPLPQISEDMGVAQPDRTGAVDKISAALTGAVDAVPIAGPTLKSGLESVRSAVKGMPIEDVRAETAATEAANPVATTMGRVTGTVLPFVAGGAIPAVAKGLGMSGNLATRVAAGTVSGGGIAGVDTAVRGGDVEDVRNSMLLGGFLGAGLPVAGKLIQSVMKGGAVRPPIGPVASDIKAGAGVTYDAAKATGAVLDPATMNILGNDVRRIADEFGAIMPNGKVAPGYNRAKAAMKAIDQYAKGPISVQQALTLRKMVANVAGSADKQEAALGSQMLAQVDDFFESLPDQAFTGGNGKAAVEAMGAARTQYAQAMRTSAIEEAMNKARLNGGGEEALRTQFRSILTSSKKRRGFSAAELDAIDKFVTKGNPVGNLFRSLSQMGGIPALAVAGTGVRGGLDSMARSGAAGIRDMVATGASAPVKEGAGGWLKRLLLEDMPGTSRIGPAGYGSLATIQNP